MNYLTLGFSMACFIAAGLIALTAPAHAGLGGEELAILGFDLKH